MTKQSLLFSSINITMSHDFATDYNRLVEYSLFDWLFQDVTCSALMYWWLPACWQQTTKRFVPLFFFQINF